MEIRDVVFKALEEARAAGKIGHPLEARIILEATGEDLALLKKERTSLPSLFIVSQVEVQEGNASNGLVARVETAIGAKCERCWNRSTSVGKDLQHPDLCERCRRVLALVS